MDPMKSVILVVGSLLWEDGPRDTWRQSRLQLDKRQVVSAPIRYGRRSETRASTFTMVLDPTARPGQAVLLPCLQRVETSDDLVKEAEELWRAERNTSTGSGIRTSWGCVGVRFRDDLDHSGVANGWSQYFRSDDSPIAPIDHLGTLGIPWPVLATDGTPVAADVILATATRAEPSWPTSEEIADAWVQQNQGHERYFFLNVQNGIRTADDQAIAQHMIRCAPAWMASDSRSSMLMELASEDGSRSLNPG